MLSRHRKLGALILAMTALPVLVGGILLYRNGPNRRPVTRTQFMMGTLFSITAHGRNSAGAIEAAFDRIREIEQAATSTSGSEVAHLNSGTGKTAVPLGQDVRRILTTSLKYWRDTEGAFDITVGPLVRAWGFDYEGSGRVPARSEIAQALAFVGSEDVILSKDGRSARLAKPGMVIDLGGVAKGYAVEEAAKVLRRHGIANALIDGGQSSIKALGKGPKGRGWRIGVGNPRTPGEVLGIITLQDGQAIGTSSDSQRFFEKDGRRYSHLIDPRTGYPAQELSLVTVVTTDAMVSDILSTALLVNGPRWSAEYLSQRSGRGAVLVGPDGILKVTPGLAFEIEP